MAQYGELRADFITYTTGTVPAEANQTITVSSLIENPSFSGSSTFNNITVTGDAYFQNGVNITGILVATDGIQSPTINTTSGYFDYIVVSGTATVTNDLTVSGNTGIGTSSPTSKLHVVDTTTNLQLESTANGSSGKIDFIGKDASSNSYRTLTIDTSATGEVNIETDPDNGGYSTNKSIIFKQAGSEKARIDDSGNVQIGGNLTVDTSTLYVDSANNRVGIGTTNPTETLTVDGNIEFESNTQSIKFAAGNSAVNSIEVNSGSGPRASIDFLGVGTSQTTDIVFKTPETSSTSAERMRIKTTTGSVGIGTTTPAVKLDVNGEIRASTGVLFGTDTAAVNTLDDYEEGTWTPGIQGATTAGSYTFTSTGAYTKVGNKVTVWGELTNITTVSAGSGITRITGLPFTNSVGFDAIGSILLDQWDLTSTAIRGLTAQVIDNVNYMQPRLTRDGATDTGLQITDKTNNNADIRFCITYTVA